MTQIVAGSLFVPGTPIPVDVNAALKLTQDNLDNVYPSNKKSEDYPLSGSVRQYLAKATVQQVNDAITSATGAWAPPSPDININNSTRHAVWTSNHGDVETSVLDNYFLHGKPWPTNDVIKSVITGSGGGTIPAIPLPATATVPQIITQLNQNTKDIAALKASK